VVVHPHRGRRGRHRGGRRARPARRLLRRRRRAGGGRRVAARGGGRAGREAAAARPARGRPAARRRGRGRHDDRGARSVERQGQARAGLGAEAPELARGLRAGRRMNADDGIRAGVGRVTGSDDELRSAAFAIAYRMLGSVAEAEDVVQEALLRVHQAGEAGERIESPRAYVATVATRLAIDQLRSARVRREAYVGEWLPEPVVTDPAEDPAAHAEEADTLSMAFLLVLERLSPVESADFLLHDVFGYGYSEVAGIVGKSVANCRQLALRARQLVEAEKPRFEASRRERDELAARFFAAVVDGDMDGLVETLAADVVVYGDGGGKAPQWAVPIVGVDRVARLFAG